MKPYYFIITVMLLISASFCCTSNENNGSNIKDLEENMMDIRVYHENLGGDIKKGDIEGAKWLLTGMDSILLVVSAKFTEHRKLGKPFSYYYDKDIKGPIDKLSTALEKKDIPAARSAYTLLTKKCNGCHDEHDIYKEVQNWLK
jgi:hypothetical protein